jgi:hypothetical protein
MGGPVKTKLNSPLWFRRLLCWRPNSLQRSRRLFVAAQIVSIVVVAIFGLMVILLGPQAGVAVGYPPPGATPTVTIPLYNYYIYLPLVMKPPVPPVAEYDIPPCRWPHTAGDYLGIAYNWGDRLQTPGTLWRIAFEAAVSDWTNVPTKVYFSQNASGTVILNTEDIPLNQGAGDSQPLCQGTTTVGYSVWGNIEADIAGQTDNQRHAEAGHETGHSQSLGHIPGPDIALLGYNPDNNVYFVPQQRDIDLVKQVYP